MEKYFNKFYDFIDKIGKHNFVLITFILIVLIITGLYQTFSLYTESEEVTVVDGVDTYSFILNANNTTNSVTIVAGNKKNLDITVYNKSDVDLLYGLYYTTEGDLTDVNIGYLTRTASLPNGTIPGNKSYVVTLKVDNNSSSDITIDFGLKYGFFNSGDLNLEDGQSWLSEYISIDSVNAPNLDNGNLIPVYYDDTAEVWKKADSSNRSNSWYDYDNKMWANAVLINSSATTNYGTASVGTTVADADITAFYVWIPRFKYRIWNLNRQAGVESTYAYSAYSTGIEIEFEYGTASTGNVECIYNTATTESSSNLSDACYLNESTTAITTTDLNTSLVDENEAWYTHPAFTFGDKEIEGFWVGKFETSTVSTSTCYTSASADNCNNTSQDPRILPDVRSLRYQTVSNQFTTAKKFQNYLSSDIDAHMLTNLEWGAVAYLTHSIYGLCSGTSCQGVYHNNSNDHYTGRSGGAIAGSEDLYLKNVYGTSVTESYNPYNEEGYYTYKGYFIDYSGNVTTTKDISKVSSTTGNITGVYDMSGGASEYVMGNMVDSSNKFFPNYSGSSWNGSTTLDSKYYNSYSYGSNNHNATGFNRARLGDATSEIVGSSDSTTGGWQVGSGMTGSNSYFVSYPTTSTIYVWFLRGGYVTKSTSSSFYFNGGEGYYGANFSFRSALS